MLVSRISVLLPDARIRAVLAGWIGLSFLGVPVRTQAEQQTASQFCESARKQTSFRAKMARVFAFVVKSQEPNSPNGDWIEFPDLDTVNKMAKIRSVYETAEVWNLNSGILFVSMYLTSSSGDWSNSVDYCYRPNGALAWMESELRTLPRGGARRIRTSVFSLDGKIVSQRTQVFDLGTGKPLKNSRFIDQEEHVYLTPMGLPFTSLLAVVPVNRR